MVLVVAATAVGKPLTRGGCGPRRHPPTLVGSRTLIYGVKRAYEGLRWFPETVYFACLRPRGPGIELGVDGPVLEEYGKAGTTDGFSIAGTFAAAHVSQGGASYSGCTKYQGPNCSSIPTAWIAVVDVRTRRRANVPVPYFNTPVIITPGTPPINDYHNLPLALSANAALAWLQPTRPGSYQLWATTLQPEGATRFTPSPTMIDTGNIDPSALRFISGRTLRWTNNGVPHQMTLT